MYEIFAGKKRSLVFPVMCNGNVKIDYNDNIADTSGDSDTTDDVGYGLWGNTGSFSFEAIVTPYDVNGFGTYTNNTLSSRGGVFSPSKKVMPALDQSTFTGGIEGTFYNEAYLTRTARLTHEMMLFHNSNFKIYLKNNTTHNENNPAQYKIFAEMTIGTGTGATTTTISSSDSVILPAHGTQFVYSDADSVLGLNSKNRKLYEKKTTFTDCTSTGIRMGGVASLTGLHVGQEIFIHSNQTATSLGTISALGGSSIDLNAPPPVAISSTTTNLFIETKKHASYVDDTFHIGFSFNGRNKTMKLFLDGIEIASGTHAFSGTQAFQFAREDSYIGANGSVLSGAASAVTNKQFMGEIHEMCFLGLSKSTFSDFETLNPDFDSTLMYLQFEEVDL